MCNIIGSTMHVAIVITCVVFASLFLPAVSRCEPETGGGVPFGFDESVVASRGVFEVDPSLFLNGGGEDLQYAAPFGTVSFLTYYAKDDQEEIKIIENQSLVEEMLVAKRLKTLTEIPIYRFGILLPQERKVHNLSYDTLSDRLTPPLGASGRIGVAEVLSNSGHRYG
jgi:hypothetical protein